MASFDKAVDFTLSKEGVFSNDDADKGGKTKFGITERELIAEQKKGLYFGRRIEDLTKAEAVRIYRSNYWRYDRLNSQIVATKLFDIGVNTGASMAALIAQKAINFLSQSPHVTVDGKWGPATENAINVLCAVAELTTYKALTLFQAQHYTDIVFANHSQLEFIDGWISRAGTRPPK